MKRQEIVVCSEFCRDRGLVSAEGAISRAPRPGTTEWGRFRQDVYALMHHLPWWSTSVSRTNRLQSGLATRFILSESSSDVVAELYSQAPTSIKAPTGRNVTWSTFARAALDVLTKPDSAGPETEASTIESEDAPLFSSPVACSNEVVDLLAAQRNEIRELHAMLRATLQDIEMVRRDVGDVRSLVRAVIGPKAPGRPQ